MFCKQKHQRSETYKEDIMLETILDEWVKEVKEKFGESSQELKRHCDLSQVEGVLCGMVTVGEQAVRGRM